MNREVAALQVEFTRSYLRAHCLSLSLSRRCFSCNTSKGKSICELALKCIHLSQHFHDNAAVTFPVCTSCEDDVMASVRCGVCLSVQESLVTESRDVM